MVSLESVAMAQSCIMYTRAWIVHESLTAPNCDESSLSPARSSIQWHTKNCSSLANAGDRETGLGPFPTVFGTGITVVHLSFRTVGRAESLMLPLKLAHACTGGASNGRGIECTYVDNPSGPGAFWGSSFESLCSTRGDVVTRDYNVVQIQSEKCLFADTKWNRKVKVPTWGGSNNCLSYGLLVPDRQGPCRAHKPWTSVASTLQL